MQCGRALLTAVIFLSGRPGRDSGETALRPATRRGRDVWRVLLVYLVLLYSRLGYITGLRAGQWSLANKLCAADHWPGIPGIQIRMRLITAPPAIPHRSQQHKNTTTYKFRNKLLILTTSASRAGRTQSERGRRTVQHKTEENPADCSLAVFKSRFKTWEIRLASVGRAAAAARGKKRNKKWNVNTAHPRSS